MPADRRRPREPPPPVPTLGELTREGQSWFWLYCTNGNAAGALCTHRKAVMIADIIARYGESASSDVIRRKARCGKCGHLGCATLMPSWRDAKRGWPPFPA